ncbi:hypothetical protein [Streptomyces chartreusis]|uniref:hypothetical protein n=1 Tax=Streptomyces chartreusis TaxID=1969 RepID=UPI0038215106
MRRRPNQLLKNLFIASLIILAAMHPNAVEQAARLGVGVILAVVNGIAQASADNPGPAMLAAGAIYVAYQIHIHRPRPARARH